MSKTVSAPAERRDPRVGDVFRKPSYWDRRITRLGPSGIVEFQSLRNGEPWGGIGSKDLPEWRIWAKDATLIHEGEL